jgi:transcriptional regulator with XRE-family HTH domain
VQFYYVFLNLCNKVGKTPSKVALEIGTSKPAVTRWKSGSMPSDATLVKLAEYFNVSVEYLKGETDIKKAPLSEESEAAAEFAKMYESLTAEQRQVILAAMRGMSKEQ